MGAALDLRGRPDAVPPRGFTSSRFGNAPPSCNGPRPRLRCLLDTRPRGETARLPPASQPRAGGHDRSRHASPARRRDTPGGRRRRSAFASWARGGAVVATASPPGQAPGPASLRGGPRLFDNPVVGRYTNSSRESKRGGLSGPRCGEERGGIRHEPFPRGFDPVASAAGEDSGRGGASGILHTQFHAAASRDAAVN